MWHFNVVFMLPHVVVTSGVNSNQIESVHQKWRFKTQPSTQVQLFVSNHKRFIWLPTRGIQVVTLQVQEVQLQVVAIDLHMANFMWFRPFLWSLMTKGERNEQRYELSLDDKGGDESAIMDMDREEQYWGGSIFLDKRSTQVGGASSWTLLFAFDMCIFMRLLAFA